MKTVNKFVLSVLILLISFTGFSQTQDTVTKPNENIKVNKEYDKDGNLIRYDSTYVYTWSSDSSFHFMPDSAFFKPDNMQEMRKRMQEHMQQFFGKDSLGGEFRHPFFNEDFFNNDFFDKDFFSKDFKGNEFFKEMEKMMEGHRFFRQEHNKELNRNLDSLHNEFMKERKEYFRKRDSILRKHKQMQGTSVDI